MEGDNKDVGLIEDASSLIQNAIAAENHAQLSYMSTKDDIYIEIADMIRRDRSKLMYELIAESKAQNYCIIKHTLIMAQNYKELSNRYSEVGLLDKSKECLETASRYEALFRMLRNKKDKTSFWDKFKGGAKKDDVRESSEGAESIKG